MASNSFDFESLYDWYEDHEHCRYCGKSGADAFHHIFTRAGKYTNSILNAIPLHNYTCHINIHGKLMTREWQEKFIKITASYLNSKGYRLNENDLKFLQEYDLLEIVKEIL